MCSSDLKAHNDITAVPVIKANSKLITGHEYGEEESDSELFANDYLDQVQARNDILDEQDRLDAQLEVDGYKDKK